MIFIFIASNTFLRWLLIGFDKHKTSEKKMCNGCKIPFGLAWLDSSCAWLLTLCALWNGTKHEAVVLITRYKSANCCGPNYVRYKPILKTRSTLNRSHVYEMIYIFTSTNIIIFFQCSSDSPASYVWSRAQTHMNNLTAVIYQRTSCYTVSKAWRRRHGI